MNKTKEKTVKYRTNKGIIEISPETAEFLKKIVIPEEAFIKQPKSKIQSA